MSNGKVTISFDGINLDPCLKHGLEFTGNAICPHCKVPYSFCIHVNKKEKKEKFTETIVDGKPVTTLAPDNYDVSIEFVKRQKALEDPDSSQEPEKEDLEPCNPCNRCTPNCPKLGY